MSQADTTSRLTHKSSDQERVHRIVVDGFPKAGRAGAENAYKSFQGTPNNFKQDPIAISVSAGGEVQPHTS